ncbi:TPA_asm: hypothetical protein G4X28_004795, partial [Salmonella enterica subsp. enterica serovar Derby]|nr:hypothetical protein [Salmonella enterica subsp. enterica serovar Derby]
RVCHKKYEAVMLFLKCFLRFSFNSLKYLWLVVMMLLSFYSFCKLAIFIPVCDSKEVNKNEQ